jgi:signal transduction histidine kinase
VPTAATRRALIAGAACTAALALGVVVLVLTARATRLPAAGRGLPILAVAVGWGFVGFGAYAWLRRPDNRTGPLMAWVGFAVLVTTLQIADAPLLFLIGSLFDALALAAFAHLLLAFPSGRLETGAARTVVATGYAVATVLQVLALMFGGGPRVGCARGGCPRDLILVDRSDAILDIIAAIEVVLGAAVLIAVVVLVARRWRAAGPVQRRGLEPVLLLGALILAFAVLSAVLQPTALGAAQTVFFVAFALLPLAFLLGLMRSRVFRGATVARLVDSITRDPGADALDAALGQALGDRSLFVAYWLDDAAGYVDRAGRPTELPVDGDARAATEVFNGGRRVAALVHDAGLCEEPELLRAAAGAAGLALENGRLEAQLRAQLEALRASRARIVEAGDAERRRLERDLHDGAQQRLVSLIIELQIARDRWEADPAKTRALVDSAFENARAAVEELRDLASGLHPAVLSQRGLVAAIESLATRAPLPVEVETSLAERLPAAVETAGYFVVAEALTNVAKYAHATHAGVDVRLDGGEAIVEVRDDGVGGAAPAAGSGLRGLSDRVGAVGGRLEVESGPAAGTVVRARFALSGEGT